MSQFWHDFRNVFVGMLIGFLFGVVVGICLAVFAGAGLSVLGGVR